MKDDYFDILSECSEGMPRFADGRIDFSEAKVIPVVNVLVIHDDDILILKRTSKVSTNQNKWDCVGGYLDEEISPEKKALKELKEETGITSTDIQEIVRGGPITISEKSPSRRWIIFPVMVTLKDIKDKPEPSLDWEHSKYKWIRKSRIEGFAQSEKIRDLLFSCTIAGKGEKGGYST